MVQCIPISYDTQLNDTQFLKFKLNFYAYINTKICKCKILIPFFLEHIIVRILLYKFVPWHKLLSFPICCSNISGRHKIIIHNTLSGILCCYRHYCILLHACCLTSLNRPYQKLVLNFLEFLNQNIFRGCTYSISRFIIHM